MKRYLLSILTLFLSVASLLAQDNWITYPYTPAGSTIHFPEDDGRHSSMNTLTEWWYLNLHLVGSAPEYKQYDVMLCYFIKPLTMRIFNVAEPETGIFHTDVNQTPLTLHAEAGHWDLSYNVPGIINDYSYWTYPKDNVPYSYFFHAESPTNKDELNVTVTSNRPPVAVGGDGFIPIGGKRDSSFYYTYSNMKVEGSITFKGIEDKITSGIGWIDRQFGPFLVGINPDNMYEWYSLQLDEPGTTLGQPKTPAEFNVWQTFTTENQIPYSPESRLVSGIYADDSQDTCSSFIFERTGYWYDKRFKKYYSQGWRLIDPLKDVTIDMTPEILDQVIDVTVFRFWEGGTSLKGVINDKAMDGVGFAELVASHDREILCPSTPTGLEVVRKNGHNTLRWTGSTPGSHPVGGYRVYRSTTNDGHWKYLGSTTDLSFTDMPPSGSSDYYYTVSSFDNQSATSASKYAQAVWAQPLDKISPENSGIWVFPNPARDLLTIELPWTGDTRLEVYNAVGQSMMDLNLADPVSTLSIKDLSGGVYILKFSSGGRTEIRKVVKE